MDLIYTNAEKIDQGVLHTYSLDLSYGESENDFVIALGKAEALLDYGAIIYIESTEYGGIIDAKSASSDGEIITYIGRTWHGILNSKVIEPNPESDHLIVSGDANDILAALITRLGLAELFTASENASGIMLSNYQFPRYCKGYDGIRQMLTSANAKLNVRWMGEAVVLSAESAIDYSEQALDEDDATLLVERHEKKVNHLICLGQGELANRDVVHLYVDQFGRIGETQYYTGLEEIVEIYDNNSAESHDILIEEGTEYLTELRDNDISEIALNESDAPIYDIGDIVGASITSLGIKASSRVSQKIIKINNGIITTEYKIGS